jgi:hypothetical protein
MEIVPSRSQDSEGIPLRIQLLSSRSPKEVGCSDAKGSARSQCSGVEVAQAVLKLIIGQYDCEFAILTCLNVQCGRGGRKGPDGHGSELGNRHRGLLQPALGQVRFQAKHMPKCRPVCPSSDPLWIPLLPKSSHSDPLWVVLGILYRYAGAPTNDSGRRSALKPCTRAVFERFAL